MSDGRAGRIESAALWKAAALIAALVGFTEARLVRCPNPLRQTAADRVIGR